MVSAVYPGSFDPAHNGHLDIARRAAKVFDRLIVAVYEKPSEDVLFSTEERVDLFAESASSLANVEVTSFKGLVPSYAKSLGTPFVVRGLRAGFDFETEFEMALMWRKLDHEVDVVCFMSALEYQFLYASRIKEVAELGGDVRGLVPPPVEEKLKEKFKSTFKADK